jgi:hypothetical protein
MTLLAVSGTVFVRRRVGFERLAANNEVAGFKFATIGVLYAVLLGFAVIVVWERFNDAENAVAREAGAAAAIYRLTHAIGDAPGAAVRSRLSAYLEAALTEDWPAMERGRSSPGVTRALDSLYTALFAFHPSDAREVAIQTELLHQVDLLTQARRERLVGAAGTVPGAIWFVLFTGALLTISFTLFFGNENLLAQAMMTAALSVLILSALLVVVVIDHPFAGSVKVTPEPLAAVVTDFREPPPATEARTPE